MKKFILSVCLLFPMILYAQDDFDGFTISEDLGYKECLAYTAIHLAEINIEASDIKPVVNTESLSVTKVCVGDKGSLLIICSKIDNKMIKTAIQSPCQ